MSQLLCYLDAGKSKNGTEYDRGNALFLCGGCGCYVAWWRVRSSSFSKQRAKSKRRTAVRTLHWCFQHFFQVIPNRRDESERGTKPLQREQACRTTARNYFGDNLPVSILRGRFGQGLRLRRSASSTKGQDRDRGHCPSQALSSLLAGNMLTFAPS